MPSSLDFSLPEGPRPRRRFQPLETLTFLVAASVLVLLILEKKSGQPVETARARPADIELLENLGTSLERRSLHSQAADVWGEVLEKAHIEPHDRAVLVYRLGKCLFLASRYAEAVRYLSEVDWLPASSADKREAGRMLLECLDALGKRDIRDELSRKFAIGEDEGQEGGTVLARVRGDAITREDLRRRIAASARKVLIQRGAPLGAAELEEKAAELAERQMADPAAARAVIEEAIQSRLLYLEGIERGLGTDVSVAEDVAQYRQYAVGQKVLEEELAKVVRGIGPTEISNHYEANKGRFVQKAGASFSFARLPTEAEARALIGKLAAKEPTDPEAEGKLAKVEGFAVEGEPVPEIGDSAEVRAHILALGEGEVSPEPVERGGEHHVFRVEKRRPERQLSLAEAEPLVRDDLARAKREEVLADLGRTLQVKYPVEIVEPKAPAEDERPTR